DNDCQSADSSGDPRVF
nr:immunoglobulin light chain junction region [Macaca mulatta]MOX11810.1 immunoglobulin light chain junction region [Macaca mulatta]MOX11842.1 immunoglobulin light chain junction region [Macaca mulatta]MOX12377.1 immunoglobulin light chain junction region [Macaca mulatta]